jgi:hypothetical protein
MAPTWLTVVAWVYLPGKAAHVRVNHTESSSQGPAGDSTGFRDHCVRSS